MTYPQRLAILRANKLEQVRRKLELSGPRDADEQGMVPLPDEAAEIVEAVSGSGVAVRDVILRGFEPKANHLSGGFFGPAACGANFRRLLDAHPVYLHPANAMAGVYMVNFLSYRRPHWNPDYDFSELHAEQALYKLDAGIGGVQHFCPDLAIGLELGWGGLLAKVDAHRPEHPEAAGFYDGLESVIVGVQGWIARHAVAAREQAAACKQAAAREQATGDPTYTDNLLAIAEACEHIVSAPPATFREACQWLVFFQAVAKMYNGSGEWGQLDELLRPYYEADRAAGRLDDDEAVFYLACLLLSETAYIQLGGRAADGHDLSSRVSHLVLEAAHQLATPCNIGVRVGSACSADLLSAGVAKVFRDRDGCPKFIGDDAVNAGFERLGYSPETARSRTFSGCHWLAVPGREYGMADMIKIDLAQILDVALRDVESAPAPSVDLLWQRFEHHLQRSAATIAAGIDVHLAHMGEVFPELVLDLFCHGPVERGLDASAGGVDFYTICVDGASLATVADSFAALEQRVETEGRMSWTELLRHLDANWSGPDGERARAMMRGIRRFGSGGSLADTWAERISATFTRMVAGPTPGGATMVPGLFSWAKVIDFGKRLRATPNGRRAGEPVSHGPNPEAGCNGGLPGTPSQMASAVARVQPGYGNTAPLQLDMDPGVGDTGAGRQRVEALLRAHFELGGTMINLNVMDREALLAALAEPEHHPDLIVRVTGFSAYFASLSDELKRYVIDRVVGEQ
ncbi:MAG: formate acetyltransferase [Armatimonadetes bacterium]|nr:formate acetyltransferase [Armatimonadota bacterium]